MLAIPISTLKLELRDPKTRQISILLWL
jgi:hypothetical protein